MDIIGLEKCEKLIFIRAWCHFDGLIVPICGASCYQSAGQKVYMIQEYVKIITHINMCVILSTNTQNGALTFYL